MHNKQGKRARDEPRVLRALFVFVWDARLTARRARSNDARVAMAFALDRSSIPLDPPALADYEGSARRALDDARALAEPEGQPTTQEMSSQLLRTSGGASPRTRVALPRQRRPLHEHDDPETTFMREFEVRPGPRVASRASSRPHPRASTEDSKPFARPTWMLTSERARRAPRSFRRRTRNGQMLQTRLGGLAFSKTALRFFSNCDSFSARRRRAAPADRP